MFKQQKWVKLLLMLFLTLVIGLVACGEKEDDSSKSQDESNQNAQQDLEQENGETGEDEGDELFPVTLTDKTGTEVTIEEEPERIITAVSSATEIVFAVGAGDRVVGVNEWDNYPEEVFEIEKIGDLNLNIEKIVELEPDLVVADVLNGDDVEALRNVGVKVLVLGSQSLEQVYEDIELVGKATGLVDESVSLINEMKEKVTNIQNKVKDLSDEQRLTVWVEVDPELYSAGKGSFIDELLTIVGANNLIGDMEGWPQVSEEIIIERNPDVIITTYGDYVEDPIGSVLGRENWSNIEAIKNEKVVDFNPDLITRAGPRLVDGLVELAEVIYPELFK